MTTRCESAPPALRSLLPALRRSARRALVGSVLLACACESAGGPPLSRIAERVNATLDASAVLLAPGDEIDVRFAYAPTWNQTVTIAPDGSASFLGVGRLIAAGMPTSKLGQALEDSYRSVLDNGQLDVVVRSFGARHAFVFGEVLEPGELELGSDRRLSLLEALARAGGPKKESAYLAQTLLVRFDSATGAQRHWTIDARPEHWKGSTPLLLQPYDVIYVPNTPIDAVGIWVDNYIRRMIPFPYLFTPVR
ncbi:MAG: hypothetical protein EPO68_13390 [Planctomycetota bacterium]|nr:MAG: hypothetical protein EPO68_13390 [Planctomycetota bacterium]